MRDNELELIKVKQLLENTIREIFVCVKGSDHAVYLAFKGVKNMEQYHEAANFLNGTKLQMDIYCGSDDKFDVTLKSDSLSQTITMINVPFFLGSLKISPLKKKFEDGNVTAYLFIYKTKEIGSGDGRITTSFDNVEIPLDVAKVNIHC